jgi:hypothetical protein
MLGAHRRAVLLLPLVLLLRMGHKGLHCLSAGHQQLRQHGGRAVLL